MSLLVLYQYIGTWVSTMMPCDRKWQVVTAMAMQNKCRSGHHIDAEG
jgi:hypothetical protein